MPILVFVFLAAEVAILIKLAQLIGGGLVLAEIVVTAIFGYLLLRQARTAIADTRAWIEFLIRPTQGARRPGWSLLLPAVLLILPGILTDILGLTLLARYFVRGGRVTGPPPPEKNPPEVIDVDFKVHDDDRHDVQ